MSLRFDYKAQILFQTWDTDGKLSLFILCIGIVILYAIITTFVMEKYLKENLGKTSMILIASVNMFVLMSYNFWIIIALIFGKLVGFICY